MIAADSRAEVIERQREFEQASKREAKLHHLNDAEVAALRGIRDTHAEHMQRVPVALSTIQWLTAEDLTKHLDTMDAHARLSGLRALGYPVTSTWVLTATATGGTRCVRAYRLPLGSVE